MERKKITLCGSVASDKTDACCPPTCRPHRKTARSRHGRHGLGSVSHQWLPLAAGEGKAPMGFHQAAHFNLSDTNAQPGWIRQHPFTPATLRGGPQGLTLPGLRHGLYDLPTRWEALRDRASEERTSCPRTGRQTLLSVQCSSSPAWGRKPAPGRLHLQSVPMQPWPSPCGQIRACPEMIEISHTTREPSQGENTLFFYFMNE